MAKRPSGGAVIRAEDAFKLHDTYGFPLDLTQVMAEERGLKIDVEGFNRLMDQAREQAKAGGGHGDAAATLVGAVQQDKLPATKFVGYQTTQSEAQTYCLLYRLEDHQYKPVQQATAGEQLAMVLGETPFYAESGGQVGDIGAIVNVNRGTFRVQNTIKVGDVFFHMGVLEVGPFMETRPGSKQVLSLRVDVDRRAKIMANHTTTHLMNKALRALVTATADQKGSLVDDQKLRFDFSHNAAVTAEQIEGVEKMVNDDIAADLPVYYDYAPQEQALKIHGLRAVFGEKYPPLVRVVSIGVPLKELLAQPGKEEWTGYSIEFCGGTHLAKTGDAQGFTILSEEAVGKGVRRITALTGAAAREAVVQGQRFFAQFVELHFRAKDMPLKQLAAEVADLTKQAAEMVLPATARTKLREGLAELQKLVKEGEKERSRESSGAVAEQARKIAEASDGPILVAALEGADADGLRAAMDVLKKKKPDSALLLGGVSGDKVSFVAVVPEAMIKKGLKAGDWVREVAKAAGGGGGGRPDMAQAGGKDPAKLHEALEVGKKFAVGKVGMKNAVI